MNILQIYNNIMLYIVILRLLVGPYKYVRW